MSASILEGSDVRRLSFDGQIAVRTQPARPRAEVRFSTLTGMAARVHVPARWGIHSVSIFALFEHPDANFGFQRVARGSALLSMLYMAPNVHPDAVVSMNGGVLGHYALDLDHDGVTAFSLWQGPHSDVFTFDHESLEQALEAFTMFSVGDAPRGAVVQAPVGWELEQESATVDCGTVVLNLTRREEGTVPPWEGGRGRHVSLYRMDDHGDRVLAATSTAVALVGRDTGHDPVSDDEVAQMAEELDFAWGGTR